MLMDENQRGTMDTDWWQMRKATTLLGCGESCQLWETVEAELCGGFSSLLLYMRTFGLGGRCVTTFLIWTAVFGNQFTAIEEICSLLVRRRNQEGRRSVAREDRTRIFRKPDKQGWRFNTRRLVRGQCE